jgi:hypothetical protein
MPKIFHPRFSLDDPSGIVFAKNSSFDEETEQATQGADPLERFSSFVVHAGDGTGTSGNCGVGPDGFQPGNTCASGGGSTTGNLTHDKVLGALAKYSGGAHAIKLASELKMSQKATKAALGEMHAAGHIEDLGGGIYGAKKDKPAPSTVATPISKPSGTVAPSALKDPAAHAPALAKAILADKGMRYNLVDVADLGKALGKSPADTLAVVHHLRKEGVLSGSYYEGRGTLNPEQLAVKAAQEGSRDMVGLVSVKDHEALRKLAGK